MAAYDAERAKKKSVYDKRLFVWFYIIRGELMGLPSTNRSCSTIKQLVLDYFANNQEFLPTMLYHVCMFYHCFASIISTTTICQVNRPAVLIAHF